MQNELISDHEFQKTKNRYKFSQATNYVKNTDIGGRMSRYETYYGWDFYKEFDTRVLAVSKEDVQRVMKKYFSEDKVTIAYGYPKEGEKNPIKIDEDTTPNNDETETLYNKQGERILLYASF